MSWKPDAVCDGGDLDCGSGLLLIIRNALAPLASGRLLEVKSREKSVAVDLPAWCRMVGHALAGTAQGEGGSTSYFVRKHAHGETDLAGDLERARNFRWSVRVSSQEGMKARAYVRNHAILVGQPASFDTEDEAPSAVEYLLAALAADLAVGLRWRASRRGLPIRNLEVALRASANNILVFLGIEGEDGHPGLERIEGRLFVDADVENEVIEELWRETLSRSPLAQTLERPVSLSIERRNA